MPRTSTANALQTPEAFHARQRHHTVATVEYGHFILPTPTTASTMNPTITPSLSLANRAMLPLARRSPPTATSTRTATATPYRSPAPANSLRASALVWYSTVSKSTHGNK